MESRPKFVIETNIKFKSKAFLHKCEPSSQKRDSNQQMEKGKSSGFEGIKELFYINLYPWKVYKEGFEHLRDQRLEDDD